MRKTVAIIAAGIFTITVACRAESPPGNFGAGFILEDPWGGTIKYWLTDNIALDAALGFGATHHSGLHAHVSGSYNAHNLFPFPKGELSLMWGGGLYAEVWGDFDFGMRLESGVEWFMPWKPVGVFAEIAPTFKIYNNFKFEFEGAGGARWYF
jgi:hypothetical protein